MTAEPTTADALRFHFEGRVAPPGWVIRSGLVALIKHAREETGRDPGTGRLINPGRTGSWLGATAYLILLDQIGKCLKPRDAQYPTDRSSVERALEMWSGVGHDERCAIYALRNALAHDFCLFNPNPTRPAYQHCFTLDVHPTRLIALPAEPWSGDYANLAQRTTTVVSLRALGDVVEEIVGVLRRETAAGNVEIVLSGGPSELMRRYGILHPA